MTNAFLICRFIIFSAVHYVRNKQFTSSAKRYFMKKIFDIIGPLSLVGFAVAVAMAAFFLSDCAGAKSEQIPTITGNNSTITINQAPSVEKASKTSVDAAGSGYGSVEK